MEKPSPRSRQVVEFKYEYPMFEPYLKPFGFESDPNFDLTYFVDSDTDEEVDEKEIADSRETLVKHVQQVRESFGFDVDCAAPIWFPGNFYPIDLSKKKPHAHTMDGAQHAIDEINAEMSGRMYKLVKVDKEVLTRSCRILHLTLTAKEVEGTANAKEVEGTAKEVEGTANAKEVEGTAKEIEGTKEVEGTANAKEVEGTAKEVEGKLVSIQALVWSEVEGYELLQWRFKPPSS